MSNLDITLLLAFIGALIAVVTPIIKLNSNIVKLNASIEFIDKNGTKRDQLIKELDKEVHSRYVCLWRHFLRF